jgi:hypothetical protein
MFIFIQKEKSRNISLCNHFLYFKSLLMQAEKYMILFIKWLLKLSDLDKRWYGSTIFRKIFQY